MEQPLVNILDQCIDRIAAGETVDDCLLDYPEHADELRDLLTIGRSLGELVTATEITSPAQSRLQQQLVDHIDNRGSHMPAMREKRKRRTFGMMSLGAAAVLALIMGVGIGVFATMSTFNPSALPPAVAEPTASNRELVIRHNPGLFTIPRQGDTSIYFDVDIYYFGEPSEYLRIAAPTGLGIVGMEPISLQGWTLSTQDGLVYTFGDEVMRSSGIQIYSGKGNDRYGNVYIGHTESIWRLGDRLILRDANNDVLLDAAMHDILPTSISTAYDNTVMIYSEALYTDMFDPSILTHMPIYVDVINPGTDDEHIRIDNWLNVQDFDLSGWTLTSDTGIRYMLPNMEWYQPWGADRHIDIYTLPRTASIGKYHMDMSEPVWQSANTLTLTRPDGLSGTLVLHNEADSPQSPIVSTPVPNNGVQTIRPVYRYELDDPFLAQGCTVKPAGFSDLRMNPDDQEAGIRPLFYEDLLTVLQTSWNYDSGYHLDLEFWLLVETADGQRGWIPADETELLADCGPIKASEGWQLMEPSAIYVGNDDVQSISMRSIIVSRELANAEPGRIDSLILTDVVQEVLEDTANCELSTAPNVDANLLPEPSINTLPPLIALSSNSRLFVYDSFYDELSQHMWYDVRTIIGENIYSGWIRSDKVNEQTPCE